MLDHVGFPVSDFERSKRFYEQALSPLARVYGAQPLCSGFGGGQADFFWIAMHPATPSTLPSRRTTCDVEPPREKAVAAEGATMVVRAVPSP